MCQYKQRVYACCGDYLDEPLIEDCQTFIKTKKCPKKVIEKAVTAKGMVCSRCKSKANARKVTTTAYDAAKDLSGGAAKVRRRETWPRTEQVAEPSHSESPQARRIKRWRESVGRTIQLTDEVKEVAEEDDGVEYEIGVNKGRDGPRDRNRGSNRDGQEGRDHNEGRRGNREREWNRERDRNVERERERRPQGKGEQERRSKVEGQWYAAPPGYGTVPMYAPAPGHGSPEFVPEPGYMPASGYVSAPMFAPAAGFGPLVPGYVPTAFIPPHGYNPQPFAPAPAPAPGHGREGRRSGGGR